MLDAEKRDILVGDKLVTTLVLEGVKDWQDSRINPEWIDQILLCRNSSGFIPTDDDVRRHLHGDVLTIGFRDGTVVGFNSIEFRSPKDVWGGLIPEFPFSTDGGVYFAGALIDGSAQNSGFYRRMNEERVMNGVRKGMSLVFTETQNPNVEAGMQSTMELMKSGGTIQDYTMDDRLLLPGLYGRCMYAEIPKNARISYGALNYQAGDAYALVFHLKLK